jgi:glycosyltransferase involved in cell wall biosynthesis
MALVSIVTIVKNHSNGLTRTLESVKQQEFLDWEMLIVIGQSIDDTHEIGHLMAMADPRIRIVNQDGTGIYAAMNLGLNNLESRFTWFLNAGDQFFSPLSLGQGVDAIRLSKVGLVVGGYKVANESRSKVHIFREKELRVFQFSFNRHGGCHQAMIFDTSAVKSIGGFDLQYDLASDFDLVLRIIKISKAKRIAVALALIEPGGVADSNLNKVFREKHAIRRSIESDGLMRVCSCVWTCMARSRKRLRDSKFLVRRLLARQI